MKCGSPGHEMSDGNKWYVRCSDEMCDNENQAPVEHQWKGRLLWMQKNAKSINYEELPFFDLAGLNKTRAKTKMRHIDNCVRTHRNKANLLKQLELNQML